VTVIGSSFTAVSTMLTNVLLVCSPSLCFSCACSFVFVCSECEYDDQVHQQHRECEICSESIVFGDEASNCKCCHQQTYHTACTLDMKVEYLVCESCTV